MLRFTNATLYNREFYFVTAGMVERKLYAARLCALRLRPCCSRVCGAPAMDPPAEPEKDEAGKRREAFLAAFGCDEKAKYWHIAAAFAHL